MSMLDEVLKEIFFGGDRDCMMNANQMQQEMKGVLDIDLLYDRNQGDLSNESDDENNVQLVEDDDEASNQQQTVQPKLQINEPNIEQLVIPQIMTTQQYLQCNPEKRTLLKQIGQKNGTLLGNQGSSTRGAQVHKRYPIYAFSDLHFAPTERVKSIYDSLIKENLYKHRNNRRKRFDQDYYDQLMASFSVLSEQEIKDYQNSNKESEIIYQQLKKQTTQQKLESQLIKYAQLSNESKESFTILSQETINYNPYDKFTGDYVNPLNSAAFYQEIDQLVNHKKIKLNNREGLYKIEMQKPSKDLDADVKNQTVTENVIRNQDQFGVADFFSKRYQLMEHQRPEKMFGQETQTQPQSIGNVSFWQQQPKQNKVTFKFWGEPEEPGKNLQERIGKQIEMDRKQQNDQPIQQTIDDVIAESQVPGNKKEMEFEKAIQQYSYYNQDIMDFCQGKQDNFLEKPFEYYNRVEINLGDPQFFSERLELLLHQQKQKEYARQFLINQPRGGAPSIVSKQHENRSIISNKMMSLDGNNESSDDLTDQDSEVNNMPQYVNDDGINKELQTLIDKQIKNKFNPPPIYNSIVAESFLLNNFSQDIEKHTLYHRNNIVDQLYAEKSQLLGLPREKVKHFDPWQVRLVATQQIKIQKDNREVLFEELPEKLNSQEFYKTVPKLSLLKGNFILFEYIEQRPIILNDTGMCTKASRFVYGQRALNQLSRLKNTDEQSLVEFKKMLVDRLGKIGKITFLDRNQQITLQGQLQDDKIIGITVIENDLYRAPVFKSKLPETDFVLVRQKVEEGHYIYALRPIDVIYIVGQIEPKVEIYTPHSRPLGTFSKNCLKTYIKKQFKAKQPVKQDELKAIFPKQSDQNIRNALRDCQGVQDQSNQKTWYNNPAADESLFKFDITANQVCQYESMLHSSYQLYEFGLVELKNSDKMKKTLQEFLTRHPNDFQDWVIARRIEDELNMTAWSLSASFIHSANQTGRMLLYGLGDPTSGLGGLSYIKKPLKARGEKGENAVQEKKPPVMGTDKDLRKLHVNDIRNILLTLGKSAEDVANQKRWRMINILTTFIQQAQNPDDQNSLLAIKFRKNLELLTPQQKHNLDVIEKFARNQRLTTKKQKEQYQKELDSQLNYLIQNLQLTVDGNDYTDFKEIKYKRIKRKLQNDDKNKDLEYTASDIEPYLVPYKDRYKLDIQAYLNKERKTWIEKKKKKGLL